MTCISTKNEDGGYFIPFDQIICRSTVSKIRKNGERVLYIVLKVLSNEKIKKYIAISLQENTTITGLSELF